MKFKLAILATFGLLASCGLADDAATPQTRTQALCDSQTANVLLDSELKGFAYAERGCDELVGDMLITGVESLPALPTLQITGTLYIRDTQLTDLSGLAALESVGGLVIEGNTQLTSAELNLQSTGDVSIRDNTRLSSVVLNSLESAGGFHVRGNTPLTRFESSVEQISGDVRFIRQAALLEIVFPELQQAQGIIEVNGLTTIQALSLPALTSVGGVSILNNQSLTTVEMTSLETVSGSFGIGFCSLNSVAGLSALQQVGGTLSFHNAPNLTALTGLENLSSVNSLAISRIGITGLVGLSGLTSISDILLLDQLPFTATDLQPLTATSIPSIYLTDLDSVQTIAPITPAENGNLEIGGLATLDELAQLTTVRLQNLHVYRSPGFDAVNMANLERVYALELSGNTGFDTIGLPALTTVDDDLEINNNRPLPNLTGLDALTTVGDDFEIRGNSQMTSLTGIENLETVADTFYVENNDNMTSINEVTLTDANRVWIRLNDDLPQCQVSDFLARMTNQPGSTRTDGNTGTGVCQ